MQGFNAVCVPSEMVEGESLSGVEMQGHDLRSGGTIPSNIFSFR